MLYDVSFCELARRSVYAGGGLQESDPIPQRLIAALKEVDRLSARLQELGNERREFLRRFHHDCVNPLGAITGFLSLLQESQCGELNSRQKQCVQCAEKSAQSLLEIIKRTSAEN